MLTYLAFVGLSHSLVALHLFLQFRLQLPFRSLSTHHEVGSEGGEPISCPRLGGRGGRERKGEAEREGEGGREWEGKEGGRGREEQRGREREGRAEREGEGEQKNETYIVRQDCIPHKS